MDSQENPFDLLDFGMLYPPLANRIASPAQKDTVNDIDVIEFMLREISNKKLYTDLQNHHVFLVEPPIHNREYRLKIVELLFEILLDSGAYHTYCVPIQDGYANNKGTIP